MNLGDRMKNYEKVFDHFLPWRLPMIVRVDGKAFHTLTRHMEKPFDEQFIKLMTLTASSLLEHCQGAVLAYVQSDEISLLFNDYKTLESEPWYGRRLSKIISDTAGFTSGFFTHFYHSWGMNKMAGKTNVVEQFDSRVWILPEHEVCNYFIWRQQDWTRNSIQMLARSKFSHSQCRGMNSSDLQKMLWSQHNINWSKIDAHLKRGTCVYKELKPMGPEGDDSTMYRQVTIVDKEPPIFTQDRNYVGRWLDMEEW